MGPPPLAGVRVLEFGGYIAGPCLTSALADLGAEVVKVEPLDGDPSRRMGPYGIGMVVNFLRDKASIALDLNDAECRDIARELASHAEVLVQNLRPGTMEGFGLDAGTLTALNPRLVYVSVPGYHSTGAHPRRPGYDGTLQAESAMMSLTGVAGGEPLRVGFPVVDVATAQLGVQAVLAALLARERSGRGAVVEVPMYDAALTFMSMIVTTYWLTGRQPPRSGNGQPYNAPGSDVVATADGHILISAYLDDHWARLCTALARPGLIVDERFRTNDARVAHRPEMLRQLESALAATTAEDACALLARSGIACGVVRDLESLTRSAEFQAGAFRLPVELPDGTTGWGIRTLHLDRRESRPHRVSAVGEDSEAILASLGWPADAVARLKERGVLGVAAS